MAVGCASICNRPWFSSGDWRAAWRRALERRQRRARTMPIVTSSSRSSRNGAWTRSGRPVLARRPGDPSLSRRGGVRHVRLARRGKRAHLRQRTRASRRRRLRAAVRRHPRALVRGSHHRPADGPTYVPFVRLALVRYQPHALDDARISRVVLAGFAQLTPDRVATVTADPHHPARCGLPSAVLHPADLLRPDRRPIGRRGRRMSRFAYRRSRRTAASWSGTMRRLPRQASVSSTKARRCSRRISACGLVP